MTQEQICYELDEVLDCEERFTLYEPNQKEYCEKCGSSIAWDYLPLTEPACDYVCHNCSNCTATIAAASGGGGAFKNVKKLSITVPHGTDCGLI